MGKPAKKKPDPMISPHVVGRSQPFNHIPSANIPTAGTKSHGLMGLISYELECLRGSMSISRIQPQ